MNKITYDNDIVLIGMFMIPDVGNFYGKFIYKINEKYEIQIHFNNNISTDLKTIDRIYAKLSDEKDKTFFASFFNCRIEPSTISSIDNIYIGYFDYVLFSELRTFNQPQDDLSKANIYINTWSEFCFPQGFKTHAEYKSVMSSFSLKNKMKVSFNQDIRGYYLSQNNIFNDLFVNWSLTDKEKREIESKLEKILSPYKNKFGIKNIEKHKWFIHLENIPKNIGVDFASYYLNVLMKCLTHDFGSEVNMIEIPSSELFNNTTIPISFYYLTYRDVIIKDLKYKYNGDIFNFNTFTKNEWKGILNNLFQNRKILEPYFDIIIQNNFEKAISEYHLERYIDCIAAIGKAKGYNKKTKYEEVLKNYIKNFEKPTQQDILRVFRNALKKVKSQKGQKKFHRNWRLIGIKLSDLRAMTTHFDECSKSVDMLKYISIYYILELIIIDYIFEILGISEKLRLDYKIKYIKPYLK